MGVVDRELKKIWDAVLEGLKLSISGATFKAYIKHTSLLGINEVEGRLVCEIGCGSAYTRQLIEQRYLGQIIEELNRVTEKKCEVKFKVQSRRVEERESVSKLPLFEERRTSEEEYKKAKLKSGHTFENYAVGGSNQMAYAAATAVAKKPGTAYNPLFIYGGVGLGKTHLMQGIGYAVLERGGGPVLFCSGEEFTNDLVEGIRNKTTDRVRAKYRKVKVLMIDDVQFIAGKASVQEEFFHTFNAVTGEGGQVVMTSDKPPTEIAKLEERLKSRFGAGMIVDVGPADFELRTAILLIKAKQRGMNLNMEMAQLVAERVEGVRELEGFLVKAEMVGGELNQGMIEGLLKISKEGNGARRIVTPAEVIDLVSRHYGVGVQQLKGERRTKTIVWPRQILMHLLRTELRLSQEEVGRLIGGRDHSTVIHADEKIKRELETKEDVRGQIAELKRKLLISS